MHTPAKPMDAPTNLFVVRRSSENRCANTTVKMGTAAFRIDAVPALIVSCAQEIRVNGNTFASSHSVDRIPLVADIQTGAAIVVHDVRLAFTHVFRTREFEGQRRADRYGAISLSARF